ncbi:GNAT family N-acetyltransferase [Herbidospora mongoliensis]|uniref:GNAT family N-acetyltransferase n=1 Tax=Herbidospora mongoliensis TaxID=688067 RepID=UPI0008310BEA|nr:GNAT family N-acetyltransferase [Herbidospora mongoliensis]
MRQIRANDLGIAAISFVEGVRDGRPWADYLQVIGPGAVEVILTQLQGWAVSTDVGLGQELIARGARRLRHAHSMYADLTDLPSAPSAPPEGVRFTPVDRSPDDIYPAMSLAYPPGHPDHPDEPRDRDEVMATDLIPLLDGTLVGPLMPCSALAVNDQGAVVAGVFVNDFKTVPWVTEVFRHPELSVPGTGGRLLRHVQLQAAAAGVTRLGLAVTDGNPAQRVYSRLGFTVTHTSFTVVIGETP